LEPEVDYLNELLQIIRSILARDENVCGEAVEFTSAADDVMARADARCS